MTSKLNFKQLNAFLFHEMDKGSKFNVCNRSQSWFFILFNVLQCNILQNWKENKMHDLQSMTLANYIRNHWFCEPHHGCLTIPSDKYHRKFWYANDKATSTLMFHSLANSFVITNFATLLLLFISFFDNRISLFAFLIMCVRAFLYLTQIIHMFRRV